MAVRWVGLHEIAEWTDLKPETLRRYLRRGRMPEVGRWVESQPEWKYRAARGWVTDRGPRRRRAREAVVCGTTSGWRDGCDCDQCRSAHNIATRDWRRGLARVPDHIREAVLADLALGGDLGEVAEAHDLTPQRLHGQAAVDPVWRKQFDEALMAGRDPSLAHGYEMTYRKDKCRCPDCRQAHHRPEPHRSILEVRPRKPQRRTPRTLTCHTCGNAFDAISNLSRYCGPDCGHAARLARATVAEQ
ncbi:hypothetical protein GCM10022247_35860 [Allokutzneria multivorans]|uniref:Uncharacterized protein n=1 Tax=Allokutzneria multivorans TaxID=1142134 RepID=A0ABP7SEC8_9PSEU